MDLFRSSTVVTIGNGEKASFWHDSWQDGASLKALFPNLFAVATRKNRTVKHELQNDNWIKVLVGISRIEHLLDAALAEIVEGLQLQHDTQDSIRWRWTDDGRYSASSAYKAQFVGSYSAFDSTKVWKAVAELKCKFFAWTVLHKKILTAENLTARGWENEERCILCSSSPETVQHLCMSCTFLKSVWETVRRWNWNFVSKIYETCSIDEWWDADRALITKERKREMDGLLIYTIWNVWKERNRHIFSNEMKEPEGVAHIIHEDFNMFRRAILPRSPVVISDSE